ncbi:toll/interleukin-1 receptor domain-containing protein [Thalassotalea mangrovi]|uniref:toll/interleukin-1 receptor domain-containing protein n=1 Tax=Thalassotalea mangrovi TaxID=2572245 RepID=UPI00145DF3C2|nr:toll/interleukin-1 receptor domain-containing protein [Thalassotalea mangrovi]
MAITGITDVTDVFISYSNKDKNIANQISSKLESVQLKCWIAPRDLKPGEDWASGIVRGIDGCACMIVVLSNSSNCSNHVLREVERAVSSGVPIIPFKIDDVLPSDAMDYFLKVSHWLDAQDMKLDVAIETLSNNVATILQREPKLTANENVEKQNKKSGLTLDKHRFTGLVAIAMIGVASVYSFFHFSNYGVDNIPQKEKSIDGLNSVSNSDNVQRLPSSEVKEVSSRDRRSEKLEQVKRAQEAFYAQLKTRIQQVTEPTLLQHFHFFDDLSSEISEQFLLSGRFENSVETNTENPRVTFYSELLESDSFLLVYIHLANGVTFQVYPTFNNPSPLSVEQEHIVGADVPFELEISEDTDDGIVQFVATPERKTYEKLNLLSVPVDGLDVSVVDRRALTNVIQSNVALNGVSQYFLFLPETNS